jgi:putative ABC transport system substrate-binding protein
VRRRRALLLAAAAAPAGAVRAADPALVAVVFPGSPPAHAHMIAAFRRGLAQAGLVEGRDVALAVHYLDGDFGRLPAMTEAVIAARPRVLVCGPSAIVAALRAATATVPIVMVTVGDPVGSGFADSLARPGGNVTGLSNQSADLVEKQFALIPELIPRARRALGLRGDVQAPRFGARMEATFLGVAARFGFAARVVVIDERPELEVLRAAIDDFRPDALFAIADPVTVARRRTIVAIADAARLPIVAPFREFAEEGALASYGANLVHAWERAAWFVDRILKGANPATVPIEQPTRFDLVINLKTARALGVTVPLALLASADDVIE